MKKALYVLTVSMLGLFLSFSPPEARAQSLSVLAKNTVFGTLTGAGLGGATMALTNDADLRPLRVGTGLGTIGGVGIGIFDMATMSRDMQVYGLLNSSSTSGGIILLDTVYGSAIGSLVGMSVSLIGDSRIVKGLQHGAGIGAFGGFGFGLVDAFYFGAVGGDEAYFDFTSSNPDSFQMENRAAGHFSQSGHTSASGLLSLHKSEAYTLGAMNPTVVTEQMNGPNGNNVVLRQYFGLEILNLSARF
ncbi:MAG: hypothetical protein ACOC2C_02760 [Cyclonatronaceae bacterium]